MPTPEPIATPVPVNAQRERIESDAYIAVEELIFAEGFLFYVGVGAVFSLRRGLPPTLVSNLKLTDSEERVGGCGSSARTGLTPSKEEKPQSRELGAPSPHQIDRSKRHMATPNRVFDALRRWAIPSSVALTEGIIVIFFCSP